MGKEGKKKKQIKLKRGLEPELNAVVERAAAGAVDGGDAGPRVGVENSAFARALASGDWHTRERGVRKLHEWLSTRVDAVTGKDLRYLWKGLFYCFWHSDKVPVQMELADRLASFVINLPHRSALLYYENFLDTMAREWSGIDRLRLDKFMTLTRVFLKSAFARMSRQHWHPDTVVPFSEALRKALGKAGSAGYVMTGFTLHIASIFIDELQGICNEDAASPDTVPWDVLAFLIDPFRVLLASSPSKAVVKRVRDSVYVKLTSEALGCLKSVAKGRGGGAGMAYAQADGLAMTEQLFELAALPQIPRMNRDAIYDAINATERLAVYQEDAPLFSGAEGPARGGPPRPPATPPQTPRHHT